MAKKKESDAIQPERSRPPLSPEARRSKLAAMAWSEVEYKIANHTASSQLLIEVIRQDSEKSGLELEKLKNENELLKNKSQALKSAVHAEELAGEAIKAFKAYSGQVDEHPEQGDYYD